MLQASALEASRPSFTGTTIRAGDPDPSTGVLSNGQVVRAIRGRAGDSLDAISFVVGPPIPAKWSPKAHSRFPKRVRLSIRTVLLASRRLGCLLHMLNRDLLDSIIGMVAVR